jgi:hypothetical protein
LFLNRDDDLNGDLDDGNLDVFNDGLDDDDDDDDDGDSTQTFLLSSNDPRNRSQHSSHIPHCQ